jgi:hypothetical protein
LNNENAKHREKNQPTSLTLGFPVHFSTHLGNYAALKSKGKTTEQSANEIELVELKKRNSINNEQLKNFKTKI